MAGAFSDTELAKVVGEYNQVLDEALVNKEAVLLNIIENGKVETMNERGANIIVEVYSNAQFNAFASGGSYAQPGSLTRIKMNVPIKRKSHPGRIDRDAIEAGGKEDLVNVVGSIMESAVSGFSHELNQQCYGDGTGVKAVVESFASSTSLVCQRPYGVYQLLETGTYQVYTSAGVARGVGEIYTANTKVAETRTAVMDAAGASGGAGGAIASGDYVCHPGSYGLDITGLQALISTSTAVTLQGFSRATYPMLKGTVDSNGGILRSLSVALFERNFGRIQYKRGAKTDARMIISSPTQWNAYSLIAHTANNGGEIKRFPGVTKILDLGYEVHEFGGRTWTVDTDCSDRDLWITDLNYLRKYEYKKMGLREGGGANGLFPIYGTSNSAVTMVDSDMFTMTWKGNLGILDPGRQIRIADLETLGLANCVGE